MLAAIFLIAFFVVNCAAKSAKSASKSSLSVFSTYEDPFYSKTLEEYKDLRIGDGEEEAIWHYKGIIRNPITGNEVVGVEGIERAVLDPATSKSKNRFSFFSSKAFCYTDLNDQEQEQPVGEAEVDMSVVAKSAKAKNSGSSDRDEIVPIKSYRVRPLAPEREVQPLTEVHQLVTIGYRPRAKRTSSDSSDSEVPTLTAGGNSQREGKNKVTPKTRSGLKAEAKSDSEQEPEIDFFSTVQWPGGRVVHTNKLQVLSAHVRRRSQKDSRGGTRGVGVGGGRVRRYGTERVHSSEGSSSNSGGGVEVVHYLSGASAKKDAGSSYVSLLLPESESKDEGESKGGSTEKGATKAKGVFSNLGRWVSFAASSEDPHGRYGKSQEYYSLSKPPSTSTSTSVSKAGNPFFGDVRGIRSSRTRTRQAQPISTMRCTRYGECPPWYAQGRACSTEITANRYRSVDEIPIATRRLFEKSMGKEGWQAFWRGRAGDLKELESKQKRNRQNKQNKQSEKGESKDKGFGFGFGSLQHLDRQRDLLLQEKFVAWPTKLKKKLLTRQE